jgi:hypothetical protein
MAEKFESIVLDGHKGLAFEIPFDPGQRWGAGPEPLWPGRRGYRVQGTVNKVRFESAAVGRARKFFVLVTDEMKKAAKLREGSTVSVFLSALPR